MGRYWVVSHAEGKSGAIPDKGAAQREAARQRSLGNHPVRITEHMGGRRIDR